MKKVAFLLIAFSAVLAACDKQAANRPYAVDEQLERNVEQTLDRMTLEEKVGQMTQLVTDLFGTNDAYSNMQVGTHFTKSDTLTVSVDVTNTGQRAGKESVLLFSSDLIASMVPDGRRQRQFEKIELQPGEKRTVTFSLPASDLSFVGYDGQWTLEPGDFLLTVGTEQKLIVCE